MLLKLIEVGADFLQKNPHLVAMVIGIEEMFKKWLEGYKWFKGWHKIVLAFVLAFFLVIQDFPPKFTPELIAQVVAIGGVASGLFAAGQQIIMSKKQP